MITKTRLTPSAAILRRTENINSTTFKIYIRSLKEQMGDRQ
jgi:hypothetical protein